ncbi:hypothetical protein DQ04_00411210 [Trypanosoma grayi]|uniref:hypothetical protein n=1 Tax=Trypanosoma grayi TaxID=71804 RepID=UPI0004F44513|nr:hypothetical protein DQ04_00411210 [Trypanosoma grayi]KEG14557.1 hypothetical protein DQ04_00411210 [Trypanosoma grayi]
MSDGEDGRSGSLSQPAEILGRIFETVSQLRRRQNAWNEELRRFFLTEGQQKLECDRLTERVNSAAAASQKGSTFNEWMSCRTELGVGEDVIKEWYHIDSLVEKTPFVAIVPCPRGLSSDGEAEVVRVVDALELPRFFVQTVPLHLPLSKLAPTFIPSSWHLPEEERMSKSGLGALPYVGVPCTYGGDLLNLISGNPTLHAALDSTPCLFLNDYVPRVALCVHCAAVSGLCVVAEVACSAHLASVLRLEQPVLHNGETEDSIDVLSFALKEFVEGELVSSLGKRSFRAFLLGELSSQRETDMRSGEGTLLLTDLRFSLLNMSTLDGCEFECFTQRDILAIAKHMESCKRENRGLPPALRFLERPATNGGPGDKQPEK